MNLIGILLRLVAGNILPLWRNLRELESLLESLGTLIGLFLRILVIFWFLHSVFDFYYLLKILLFHNNLH